MALSEALLSHQILSVLPKDLKSIRRPLKKAPRPVPLLEREERQNAQKLRLRGLDLEASGLGRKAFEGPL